MLGRAWRGWTINWFLALPADQSGKSIVERLSSSGTITGIQHATIAATVVSNERRSAFNYLMGTYHFRNQVDEVLSGPFPDILLIWIGHNDIDWRWQVQSLQADTLQNLTESFGQQYEKQLRRLLMAALTDSKNTTIIIFGLINFKSFFDARAKAENLRSADASLFPYLEAGSKIFISMRPENRAGMIELATKINERLEIMCGRLAEQLQGTSVRLIFSDAMARASMDGANDLSPIDAWHPSLSGHCKLAESAFPVVRRQAEILGWIGTEHSTNEH
jgi:lysophospholipase L1-like esterase